MALFKAKGYKVASVARTIRDEVKAHSDLVISADFSDPNVFKGIFENVEKELGVPNVVIYNCESITDLMSFLRASWGLKMRGMRGRTFILTKLIRVQSFTTDISLSLLMVQRIRCE